MKFPWLMVMFLMPVVTSLASGKARTRGRGEWLSFSRRPPRDLFAARWANVVVSAINEWMWIGLALLFSALCMLFSERTLDYAEYLIPIGSALMFIRLAVTPTLIANLELDPKYEAQTHPVST